jgi:hypothetical protein
MFIIRTTLRANCKRARFVQAFQSLLFGGRRPKGIDKEGENTQKFPYLKEPSSNSARGSDWFWGFRREEPAIQPNNTHDNIEKFNENKQNLRTKDEIDPFSSLLFGDRRPKGIDKEGENTQKFPDLKEPSSKSTRGSDWFW